MKLLFSSILVLFSVLYTQNVYSQTFGNGYYRLTNQWLGEEKSLDVVNSGEKNKLQMATTAEVTGQFWKLTDLGDGYYRLTNQWLEEEKSLDVVNSGEKNKLQMATTANTSGQAWKITDLGNGYYRLTTKWLGEEKSLDVVNDGENNKLQMATSSNVSGQYWQLVSLSEEEEEEEIEEQATIQDFKPVFFYGFKVMVKEENEKEAQTQEALNIISKSLERITKLLKPSQVNALRGVPIWLEFKKTKGGAWYHTSKEWLLKNGYPAELEKSVEISNIANFIKSYVDQPYVILHELAHAYHDFVIIKMKDKIRNAYTKALESGKYEQVAHIRGGTLRHYALTSETEYFAELTEAYFGKNDYFPFNRQELEEFDPLGYQIMQEAWD